MVEMQEPMKLCGHPLNTPRVFKELQKSLAALEKLLGLHDDTSTGVN